MSPVPAIPRTTVDRLIALGRQRGSLTPEDLQAHLPIGSMSAEDIALVVIEIEDAGVSVELEDLALGRVHPDGIAPVPIAPAPGLPALNGAVREPDGERSDAPLTATPPPESAPSPKTIPDTERWRASRAVLVAGCAVLLILAMALVLLGR